MSWAGFAAVFTLFFLTHSVPVRPAIRSFVTAKIGLQGFSVMYSVLSLAMLTLLIWSAGEAPFIQLWPQIPWHRDVTHLGMLAVFLILALSIARPNPFSFGGARNDQYDPTRPGITSWTRHPILLALALWAFAHLLPNGDLAHVLLFGVLGVFAIAGQSLIDKRKRRSLSVAEWQDLNTMRSRGAWVHAPTSWRVLGLRLFIGTTTFIALLWAHNYVIGVSAF